VTRFGNWKKKVNFLEELGKFWENLEVRKWEMQKNVVKYKLGIGEKRA
jgi:hypothetical protein